MADAEEQPKKKAARRRQGPRRSEASRAAILDATREALAASGWRKFSVDSVARRAHASKQTIYRWWPASGNMCLEAATTMLQGDQGDTGAEVRATPFQVLYGGQPTPGSGAAEQRG